jgi:hypothetical protein
MNKSCYFSNPFNCYSWVVRPFQDPDRISFNLIQPNWLSEQIVLCGGALFISSNDFDACQNKAIHKAFFFFIRISLITKENTPCTQEVSRRKYKEKSEIA